MGDLPQMDGYSMWKSLSENSESPRNLMLHNIDDRRMISAVRVGDWKLMKGIWTCKAHPLYISQVQIYSGTTYNGSWDGWYGPDGHTGPYNLSDVKDSIAGKAIRNLGIIFPNDQLVMKLRLETQIKCPKNNLTKSRCNPLQQVKMIKQKYNIL